MIRYQPVRLWAARDGIDTGPCPACGDMIRRRQLVTFYHRADEWRPGEVRHHQKEGCHDEIAEDEDMQLV